MDILPVPFLLPAAEIIVDQLPFGEIVRKKTPAATALQYIIDGIHNLSASNCPRLPFFAVRHERGDDSPFLIGQIAFVRLSLLLGFHKAAILAMMVALL